MVVQQGFDISQFAAPPTTSIRLASWSSGIYLMSVFIFFLSIKQSFSLTIHFMSFSFLILWPVTTKDQVHIGTTSLREITTITPTNQVTDTRELYAWWLVCDVVWKTFCEFVFEFCELSLCKFVSYFFKKNLTSVGYGQPMDVKIRLTSVGLG
jgi:hypothetical protein